MLKEVPALCQVMQTTVIKLMLILLKDNREPVYKRDILEHPAATDNSRENISLTINM